MPKRVHVCLTDRVGSDREHAAMSALTISWLGAAALALVTAPLGYAFGARQKRERERRGRKFTGAAELVAPLRELQRFSDGTDARRSSPTK